MLDFNRSSEYLFFYRRCAGERHTSMRGASKEAAVGGNGPSLLQSLVGASTGVPLAATFARMLQHGPFRRVISERGNS